MKKICIIGSGYVGLVSGACFAELGNRVILTDNDESKIESLKKGKIPIYEPGLDKLLQKNKTRISFSSSIKEGVLKSEIIFICVGTPPRDDGSADLSNVERVAAEIAGNLNSYKLVVDKSTVPVETGEWVKTTIERNSSKKSAAAFDVASNPEFLREGTAIHDFLNPDRVVIGVSSKKAEKILTELYKPIKAPIVVTDIKSAELIKHASNSFLAMKISFINAVGNICEKVGADVTKVAHGMGLDKRIGRAFLDAGPGFGGFCFPKDLEAFYWISKKVGYDFGLLHEVKKINEEQKKNIAKKVEDALWIVKDKTIAVLGLAFKPNTDDMRMAPSIDILNELNSKGAKIKAYDPQSMAKAKELMPYIQYCKNVEETCKSADCILLLTDWEEFKNIDFKKIKKILKQSILIDARNVYDPGKMKKLGFIFKGIGK
ncbi:MAG: UDP-glucose/GDP-mannose dehydrogenase family protein [Elusimicrobia bacterium]|nr:UDP-glucose/GDP-mannose dehydrogenase family protein [Elusimicrobiota bacterium]